MNTRCDFSFHWTTKSNAWYRSRCVAMLIVAINSLALQSIARGQIILATDSRCDCLYTVNTATGETTVVGDLRSGDEIVTTMAVDLDGAVFVVDNAAGQLLKVNIETGQASAVGARMVDGP